MDEISLSNDLNVITAEINSYKQIAGQSIWEIGRRLNYVKENDLAHGEFMNWLNQIGFEHTEAKRFMKVARELPKSDTWHHLSNRALYLVATLPEEERTKEHETSKGEIKKPDEMTVRELQELKKQLHKKDEQISNLSETVIELSNKKPEVVEKKIVVEKLPSDYDSIKASNKALEERLNQLEGNYRQMLLERQETDEKSEKYEQLSQAIAQAEGQLNSTQQMISNYKNLSDVLKKSNEFLSEASALIYQDLSEVINRDGLAKQELAFLIERLERFISDLKKITTNNVIEGEIIHEQ